MTTGSFPGGPNAGPTGCAIFAAIVATVAGLTLAGCAYLIVEVLRPL